MAATQKRQTAAQKRAAEKIAAETAAQESATETLALGRVAASERIGKAERIFADIMPRVTLSDGRTAGVQREVRADGSSGPLMAAFFRPSSDGRESAQRFTLSDAQVLSDALMLSHGVALIAAPEPESD